MKRVVLLVALLLLGVSWLLYERSGREIGGLEKRIEALQVEGDPESRIDAVRGKIQELEGSRTFNGILLVIFGAGFVGILFVVFVLPNWAGRMAEGMYGSNAELEDAPGREARALLAKGDHEGAVAAFRKVAAEHPEDRMPWIEIAKIQRQQLDDPQGAIATLKEALDSKEWPDDDAAYFLFRLAEIWNEDVSEREQAVAALQRVIREFPETRHAMNARHKLRDWGAA
ncbi:MAG TPA: tetratricopeptide repeat protein [Luteolibacter sp.]|nr:tetratricopeptide repeat protein [Luteolibacter sp.]